MLVEESVDLFEGAAENDVFICRFRRNLSHAGRWLLCQVLDNLAEDYPGGIVLELLVAVRAEVAWNHGKRQVRQAQAHYGGLGLLDEALGHEGGGRDTGFLCDGAGPNHCG